MYGRSGADMLAQVRRVIDNPYANIRMIALTTLLYLRLYSKYDTGKNRYRTHYLFEPRSDDNQPQKLKRYVMEMNGNRLLDERSTFGPIGRLHSWLRRWNGRRCVKSIRKQLEEGKGS